MGKLIETAQMMANQCPSLIHFLHMDDLVPGEVTWRPRVGSCYWQHPTAYKKNHLGVYVDTTGVSAPVGTMPIYPLGKFIVTIASGTPNPSEHAIRAIQGDINTGDYYDDNGQINFDGVQYAQNLSSGIGGAASVGVRQVHAIKTDFRNDPAKIVRCQLKDDGEFIYNVGVADIAPITIGRDLQPTEVGEAKPFNPPAPATPTGYIVMRASFAFSDDISDHDFVRAMYQFSADKRRIPDVFRQ